jgi:hypothetical protein
MSTTVLQRLTLISRPSRFALLDIMLDKLLDTKNKCLVTTRQMLYPNLAVPISSPRLGNLNMPAEDLTSVYGNGWQAVLPVYGNGCNQ